MRALLLLPVVVLIVAACGFAVTTALGAHLAVKEMLTAAITCTGAGILATIPLLVMRRSTQPVVMQAALISTVIHMMLCLAVAAVVLIGKLNFAPSFIYWLGAFYFATLVVVAIASAGAVRSATPEAQKA